MNNRNQLSFIFAFSIIVLTELILSNSETYFQVHYITKPLIAGSLLAYFIGQSKHLDTSSIKLTTFALVFSILGDILLMFTDKSSLFFTSGLFSFLIAHVMYILVFKKKRNINLRPIGFVGLISVFGIVVFWILKDGLDSMLFPVILYMVVILTMATMASWRKDMVSNKSFYLVLIGALFFVLSDSLIAIDKFYQPLPLARINIMTTYAIAQLLIVLGILKQH